MFLYQDKYTIGITVVVVQTTIYTRRKQPLTLRVRLSCWGMAINLTWTKQKFHIRKSVTWKPTKSPFNLDLIMDEKNEKACNQLAPFSCLLCMCEQQFSNSKRKMKIVLISSIENKQQVFLTLSLESLTGIIDSHFFALQNEITKPQIRCLLTGSYRINQTH